ncbi:GGDEF domain-containing protein [Neobacillus sp. PS3-40]|uniref:GGDEF domain-containing protein n=1 Tax=Neobacillus sp. PS3-40 TaxID=3070679 RepID=UPI0027DEC856|nr:GGDEF domain-containing protein [Neobacillus sp. PS3-40]WML43080.1 GGDEF domain-containing protein [Neobacillus sp. PS3-40]
MKYSGRIVGSLGLFLLHSVYIFYYYFRDNSVEPLDLYSYPFLVFFGYWAGKQYDKVRFYSEKDELTGIYNRRFVMNTYDKIFSFAERANSKLFILVVDCDSFKTINDTYGHHKGDMVLIKISELLVESTRKSDIVARWGGDEFLVIGHYNGEAGLETVLNRLEKKLENLSDQVKIPVKASIGSAIYPNDSMDLFELLKKADGQMYNCKASKSIF